jgi:hypothetical protein
VACKAGVGYTRPAFGHCGAASSAALRWHIVG